MAVLKICLQSKENRIKMFKHNSGRSLMGEVVVAWSYFQVFEGQEVVEVLGCLYTTEGN